MPAGGEMAGGAPSGGMAAMMPMPMETPIDERCPDAQAGEHLLVLFKDRVDAYRIRDFSVDYLCTFLDLAGNGITQATGMAISRDEPRKILIVQPEDMNGSVYEFDLSGAFVKKTDTNINLGAPRVSGIPLVMISLRGVLGVQTFTQYRPMVPTKGRRRCRPVRLISCAT